MVHDALDARVCAPSTALDKAASADVGRALATHTVLDDVLDARVCAPSTAVDEAASADGRAPLGSPGVLFWTSLEGAEKLPGGVPHKPSETLPMQGGRLPKSADLKNEAAFQKEWLLEQLLVQATPEFRSRLLKQLREGASGAPAPPLRRSLASFGERFRGHSWARAVQ
eukprot:2693628-Alexandrium_andersonii.AAC.1